MSFSPLGGEQRSPIPIAWLDLRATSRREKSKKGGKEDRKRKRRKGTEETGKTPHEIIHFWLRYCMRSAEWRTAFSYEQYRQTIELTLYSVNTKIIAISHCCTAEHNTKTKPFFSISTAVKIDTSSSSCYVTFHVYSFPGNTRTWSFIDCLLAWFRVEISFCNSSFFLYFVLRFRRYKSFVLMW